MAWRSAIGPARDFGNDIVARAKVNFAAGRKAAPSLMPPELGGQLAQAAGSSRSAGSDAQALEHFQEFTACCVRLLASTAASQPLLVGSRAPAGTKSATANGVVPIEGHPLAAAWANPNEIISGWALMFNFVASLEIAGRAFIWMRQNEDRLELWPLSPAWVQRPLPGSGSQIRSGWEVRTPYYGEAFPIPAEDMLFAAFPNPSDPCGDGGLSPLKTAIHSVRANEAIVQAQESTFSNGIFPRHAIIVGKTASADGKPGVRPRLTVEQEQQILSSIRRRYQGVSNFDSPIVLDSLIEDIKTLSLSPRELDFASSSTLTEQRILRAYGLNEISMGAVENANRASATIADQHLCARVNKTLALCSQAVDQFIGAKFKDPRLTAWFLPVASSDPDHQLAVVQALAAMGAISKNEARAQLLGLGPIVGGDACQVPFTVVDQPVVPLKSLSGRVTIRTPKGLIEILEPRGDDEE